MIQKSYDDSASLYLIPTPIGNMDDITVRALNILRSVDIIFCEDTRNTSILLKHFDIHKKLISCHEYNERNMIEQVITFLKDNKTIGLVTDQGTPIISDPGFIIVRGVIASGYNVISLPGPTAFVPALTSSGIEPSPFLFYGFLSSKENKQIQELESLKNFSHTIIFYESVHRLVNTLENILKVFGNRSISISRELSKIYEEVIRGNIADVIPMVDSMKGEFVLVIEGNKTCVDYSSLNILEHIQLYLDDGMSEKEAIKLVARERNVAKSIIYNEYHNRK